MSRDLRGGVLIWAGLLLFFWSGCTHVYTRTGVYYRVRPGETLAQVAQKYRVELQDLAEVNNIENLEELKSGRSIYIPGVTPSSFGRLIESERRKSGHISVRKSSERKLASTMPIPTIEVDHGRFRWPLEGELSSGYGVRRGRRHDGVDIRAKIGTPVAVAADGEVVFAKRMRGYGNLVLVKHDDDFFTVYAHNSANLVKTGKKVKKGEIIAKVGRTGRATGPHLHFEVREGSKSRNPLFFLPKNVYAKNLKTKEGDSYGGPDRAAEDHHP